MSVCMSPKLIFNYDLARFRGTGKKLTNSAIIVALKLRSVFEPRWKAPTGLISDNLVELRSF